MSDRGHFSVSATVRLYPMACLGSCSTQSCGRHGLLCYDPHRRVGKYF